MTTANPSPLDYLDDAFTNLGTGPGALTVDGAGLGAGLPPRPIALAELQQILLLRTTAFEARDAVIAHLVRRSFEHPDWGVAVAGVLLPGLRRTASRLTRGYPGDPHCVDAEVIAGFFEALARCHPDRARLSSHLLWAAYRRGHQLARRDTLYARHRGASADAAAAAHRADHPDFVLARAVTAGALSTLDADLIGATRLDGISLHDYARHARLTYASVRRRRARAEARLVAFLRDESSIPCPISG